MLGINIAVYAFMLFGGVVILVFGGLRGYNAARIAAGPIAHIAGTITDKTIDEEVGTGRSSGSPTTKNDIWYGFTPASNQTQVVGDVAVSTAEWNATEVGSPVDVEFLAGDVNTNWLAGHSTFAGELEAAAFGFLLGVFVLLVVQFRFAPPNLRFPWRRSDWRP
jgi:hypothetical protein